MQGQELDRDTPPVPIPGVPAPVVAVPFVPVPIGPGLLRIKVPLPFPPHDVNAWLLAQEGGWTLIDSGVDDAATRAGFTAALAHPLLEGRPVVRLLVTHFHPDHIGLAGWLQAQTGAPLHMSRVDWLQARLLLAEPPAAMMDQLVRHARWCGAPEAFLEYLPRRGPLFPKWVGPVPERYVRIKADDRLSLAGTDWRVLIGEGHAPEMLCLHSAERKVLIAADQILARITPHIGAYYAEPEGDPLGAYLASLTQFEALDADTWVLPSHGEPFHGLHARISALRTHHAERLDRLRAFCVTPRTVMETTAVLFRALAVEQIGFGLSEALAHLRHLVARGEFAVETEAGCGAFRRI